MTKLNFPRDVSGKKIIVEKKKEKQLLKCITKSNFKARFVWHIETKTRIRFLYYGEISKQRLLQYGFDAPAIGKLLHIHRVNLIDIPKA